MTLGSDALSADAAKKRGSIVAMGNFTKMESDDKISAHSGSPLWDRFRARITYVATPPLLEVFFAHGH